MSNGSRFWSAMCIIFATAAGVAGDAEKAGLCVALIFCTCFSLCCAGAEAE